MREIIDYNNYLKEKLYSSYPEDVSDTFVETSGLLYPGNISFEVLKKGGIEKNKFLNVRWTVTGKDLSFDTMLKIIDEMNLKDGQDIIDVGSGYGQMSLLMGEMADNRIISLDPNKENQKLFYKVLENYRFEDGTRGLERITPILGEISDIESLNKRFDRVLIKDVLIYSSDYDKLYESVNEKLLILKDALKYDGKLFIYDRDVEGDEMAYEAIMNGIKENDILVEDFGYIQCKTEVHDKLPEREFGYFRLIGTK